MDLFRKYLKEMIEENPVTSRKFVPVEKLKPKVLRNALSTFAWGCTTDKVIALYDTSFFNSGKSGYLLADDAFYVDRFVSAGDDGPLGEKYPIRNLRNFVGIAGHLDTSDLPLDFDVIEEEAVDHTIYLEDDEKEISYVVLEYENDDQKCLFAYAFFDTIRELLKTVIIANKMAKAERESILAGADAAYNLKDYQNAYQRYLKAYDVEIAKGARMIGYMYDHGLGVTRDDRLALEWYLKAAEMDDAEAQLYCAVCYQLGYSGKVDYEKSFYWMRSAANNDNLDAVRQCIKMCTDGIGTEKDEFQIFMWIEQAAYMGDAESQYMLGRVYEKGTLTKKDDVEALLWFEKAARQNHTLAMAKCAALYVQSNQMIKNFDKAIFYAEKAYANGFHDIETLLNYLKQVQRDEQAQINILTEKAENGDLEAMHSLVTIYLDEHGHCFDANKGMQWMEKIADGGNAAMMVKCADLYNCTNIRLNNPDKAFQYYEKAANLGHVKAQFMCGLFYDKGEGTKVDYQKARYWYRKAADQGDAAAMHNLAILLLNGDGGERNQEESEKLFRYAASKGNRHSQEVLDKYF